jgi:hypothetical protein
MNLNHFNITVTGDDRNGPKMTLEFEASELPSLLNGLIRVVQGVGYNYINELHALSDDWTHTDSGEVFPSHGFDDSDQIETDPQTEETAEGSSEHDSK